MGNKRVSGRDASQFVQPLRDREPFRTGGALRGTDRLEGTGQLPGDLQTDVRTLAADGQLRYVVYSYATPIAWLDTDGNWTVPDTKHSVTTSKHQNCIREALRMI